MSPGGLPPFQSHLTAPPRSSGSFHLDQRLEVLTFKSGESFRAVAGGLIWHWYFCWVCRTLLMPVGCILRHSSSPFHSILLYFDSTLFCPILCYSIIFYNIRLCSILLHSRLLYSILLHSLVYWVISLFNAVQDILNVQISCL